MSEEDRMVTYVILPTTRSAVEVLTNQATELLGVLKDWKIETAEDEAQGAALLQEAHKQHKELDAKRKEAGAPALMAQREVNDLFRPAINAWNDAKNTTKRLLTEAAARKEAANRAALEEAAKGNVEAMQQLIPAQAPPAGVAYRDKFDIKIIDEDAIPREWLCIDWSALKIAAREGKPAPAGVEFVRVTTAQAGR
jgi:hypothetical protein